MKILNQEIDFSFADADCLERYEKEYPETVKKLDELKTTGIKVDSQIIREFCNIIAEFFDKVLGEGTAQKLFNGKSNYKLCLSAFKALVEEKKAEEQEDNDFLEYMEQYSTENVKGN